MQRDGALQSIYCGVLKEHTTMTMETFTKPFVSAYRWARLRYLRDARFYRKQWWNHVW